MIDALTGMGYAIIALAVVIGIGIVILGQFSANVASCPTGYYYNANGSGYTFATDVCCYTSTADCTSAGNYTAASTGATNVNVLKGYLGTSSGGLATWVPIVIVLVIGMLFLGAFLGRRKKY